MDSTMTGRTLFSPILRLKKITQSLISPSKFERQTSLEEPAQLMSVFDSLESVVNTSLFQTSLVNKSTPSSLKNKNIREALVQLAKNHIKR